MLPIKHTKLLLKYWSYLRKRGIKPSNRNKWIAGNRVALRMGIIPHGLMLTWGTGDPERDYVWISYETTKFMENAIESLTIRAINEAALKQFD